MIWGDGYISPHTSLLEIQTNDPIFYCHPTNQGGEGWGDPFIDENGQPIKIGTLGGEGQIKSLVLKKGGGFDYRAKNGAQKYGNIDWRGPVLKTLKNGHKQHLFLTYHGPVQRYIPDIDFTYDDRCQAIYHRGKYVCSPPYPVLGAGARKQDGQWFLYLIGKDRLDDVVLKYHLNLSGWSVLTDDLINAMRRPYDKDSNPLGYKVLARIPRQKISDANETLTAAEARTPWFFNQSCTEAVCLREMEAVYFDSNGNEYQETMRAKYQITIDEKDRVIFRFLGNQPRFEHIFRHGYYHFIPEYYPDGGDADLPVGGIGNGLDPQCKYLFLTWRAGDWIFPDAPDQSWWSNPGGLGDHEYHATLKLILQQHWQVTGEQIIAVDYDGDQQVNAILSVKANRKHRQEFSWGVDYDWNWTICGGLPSYPAWFDCADQSGVLNKPSCGSSSDITGKPTARYRGDPDYSGIKDPDPPYFTDGNGHMPWWENDCRYVLKFENSSGAHEFELYSDLAGTEWQHEYGEFRDDFDRYLERRRQIMRYIHFFDLRHPYFFSCTELEIDEYIRMDWKNNVAMDFSGRYQKRYDPPTGEINRQVYQRECYFFGSDQKKTVREEELAAEVLLDHESGRIIAYDWIGKPATSQAKVDYGGPDWLLSWEASYTHLEANFFDHCEDYTHRFKTEAYDILWFDQLMIRDEDAAQIQPDMATWYGLIREEKPPSWKALFFTDNSDLFGKEIQLAKVEGGLARSDQHWLLSYKQPKPINALNPEQMEDQYINLIDGDEALTIFGDEPVAKLYPLAQV